MRARPSKRTTRVGSFGSVLATAGRTESRRTSGRQDCPAAQSPWNAPLSFGHPIVMRPLKGQPGEGSGELHIVGNVMPKFRATWNNTVQYKRAHDVRPH